MGSNIIELAKLGHERAAELKASCDAVDVHSVAQLISDLATQMDVQLARSNALAAENAALKAVESNLVRNIINDLGDTEFQYAKVLTPATSAFLAEVRASGVEMFVEDFTQPDGLSNGKFFNEDLVDASREFAAQLRQGGAV